MRTYLEPHSDPVDYEATAPSLVAASMEIWLDSIKRRLTDTKQTLDPQSDRSFGMGDLEALRILWVEAEVSTNMLALMLPWLMGADGNSELQTLDEKLRELRAETDGLFVDIARHPDGSPMRIRPRFDA